MFSSKHRFLFSCLGGFCVCVFLFEKSKRYTIMKIVLPRIVALPLCFYFLPLSDLRKERCKTKNTHRNDNGKWQAKQNKKWSSLTLVRTARSPPTFSPNKQTTLEAESGTSSTVLRNSVTPRAGTSRLKSAIATFESCFVNLRFRDWLTVRSYRNITCTRGITHQRKTSSMAHTSASPSSEALFLKMLHNVETKQGRLCVSSHLTSQKR